MRGVDIQIRGVSKRFQGRSGEAEALRDITFDIRAGEFVALVGPSGCGKTTLLNMIAGLETIEEGEIRVGGKKVKGPGPDRTVIFQEAALFPWLTVRANIEYGLRIQGASRAERDERVEGALRAVQLSRFGDSPTSYYPSAQPNGLGFCSQRHACVPTSAIVVNPLPVIPVGIHRCANTARYAYLDHRGQRRMALS